jgi:hypothetical protein
LATNPFCPWLRKVAHPLQQRTRRDFKNHCHVRH